MNMSLITTNYDYQINNTINPCVKKMTVVIDI